MIPGIGFAAVGTKALGFLKGLPKWVWIALAAVVVAAIIIWRANVWFDNQIAAAEARGEARAYVVVEQRAIELKGKADRVAAKIRSQKNEEDQHVAAVVDDFRLRGPGKASCPRSTVGASGGHQQAGAAVDPALGPVHSEARPELVALPFSVWADIVEGYELLRNEAVAWRKNEVEQTQLTAEESK